MLPSLSYLSIEKGTPGSAQLAELIIVHLSPSSVYFSLSVVSDSLQPHGLYRPWNSPGQNTGVGLVQSSSVAQSCPTLCDHMDCSMPDLPVHHQLLEPTQTYFH